MAINPIDTRAGADLIRLTATHPESRSVQPPTAAGDAAAATAASETQAVKPQPAAATETAALDSNRLRFQVDKDSGKTVAQLVDTDGRVLRQIPSEEAIELAKALNKYAGMFVDRKV